ncbi:MAG: hypothetical protein BGO78_12535 [Chloroflexi bacterium 44-23]|nr:MAG: hypothetical protein BGO78_12535 [Chloroflexi bacterium 44-23]
MDILTLMEEIQATARTGLAFSSNEYDRQRYQHLLTLVTNHYADLLQLPENEVLRRFQAETGCITPKLGADAAIFNQAGQILLMERVDGSGWCLPCGWVEVNETPAEAALREAYEETGLIVEAVRLVGVYSRKAGYEYSPHSMTAIVHLCHVISGSLTLSHEGKALQYWALDAVPRWHARHELYARDAWACLQSGAKWQAVSQ